MAKREMAHSLNTMVASHSLAVPEVPEFPLFSRYTPIFFYDGHSCAKTTDSSHFLVRVRKGYMFKKAGTSGTSGTDWQNTPEKVPATVPDLVIEAGTAAKIGNR